jgi:undecaprenyl-diphosphatase
MPMVTRLGGVVFTIGFGLSLLIFCEGLLYQAGVDLALSLFVSTVVVQVCKVFFARQRPYQALAGVQTGRELLKDASFPSGHSTASFCMATVLALTFPEMMMLYYGVATLVAFSRVYLGLHYPSDIASGAALGTFTAWLVV